jgi:N-acetylglutamate synthase-like GNAT family acetyltransferase
MAAVVSEIHIQTHFAVQSSQDGWMKSGCGFRYTSETKMARAKQSSANIVHRR